jgi:hypothetical protein
VHQESRHAKGDSDEQAIGQIDTVRHFSFRSNAGIWDGRVGFAAITRGRERISEGREH